MSSETEEKPEEISESLWSRFIDLKLLPMDKYCESSIDELVCDQNKMVCFIERSTAKFTRSIQCSRYIYETRKRRQMVEKLHRFYKKSSERLIKITENLEKKIDEATNRENEMKEYYSTKYLSGYVPMEEIKKKIDSLYEKTEKIVESKEEEDPFEEASDNEYDEEQ